MVAGVDDISAVAGIISCTITLLHGCVKGFELLCRARKCDQQMFSLQLLLEFEEQKLLTWAHEVGLTERPPRLRVAIQHARLIQNTLKHLGILLCDINKLKSYGLDAEQTSEVVTDTGNGSALSRLDLVQTSELRESLQTTAAIFQNRTSPWHKLKWVTVDEPRFRRLLSDISEFNHQLQHVLEHNRIQMLERRHSSLLRNAIMSTTDQQDLELLSQQSSLSTVNKSIAATAKFKGWSLRLGFLERFRSTRPASSGQLTNVRVPLAVPQRSQSEIAVDVEEMKLLRRHLRIPSPPKPRECRQLAYYDYKPVLVEWRPVNSEAWKLLRPRVNNLASLLNNLDDPSFHSLSCQGYLRYEQAGVYGYVFNLPAGNSMLGRSISATSLGTATANDLPSLPTMRTLLELFSMTNVTPSLNVRVACAISLLETTLQLHTAGWLHKEIRSENVLFISHRSSQTWETSDLSQDMYVAGYAYARADSPQEFTEPAKSEIMSELYRHSASLGAIRLPYKKSFDIFSVGCILLELGVWANLSDILSNHSFPDTSLGYCRSNHSQPRNHREAATDLVRLSLRDRVLEQNNDIDLMHVKREMLENAGTGPQSMGTIVELLEARAGKSYANVVVDCLTAASASNNHHVAIKNEEQISALELEQRSLTRLRHLMEAL